MYFPYIYYFKAIYRKAVNMAKIVDLTGKKFNRLKVLKPVGKTNQGKILWLCQCDCGNLCKATTGGLNSGNNQSCGCLHKETFTSKTHGKRYTRLYCIYIHMKERCYNQNEKNYNDYGGRGITVCDEWQEFIPFYEWAMNNGYADNLTLDRIDVNGNYEPSNCRWATPKEQANNRRTNRLITYNGETHNIAEWAKIKKIKYGTLQSRITKRKWNIEKALNTP